MANFIHKWLNPHCPHCEVERREANHCESCDILRTEIARLQRDNESLLNRILTPPKVEEVRTTAPTFTAPPKMIPWKVRQQMLEQEDKQKARIMSQAGKPDESVNDLEKELDVAEQVREGKSGY